jgi:ABC-type lipoprotein export system ATPase subunit
MKVFGLTNLTVEERERNRLKNYNKDASKKLGVIYEGDSHSINTLGIKNTWIKFSNIDFASLRKAFQDHQINIYTSKPQKSDKFIKGMVVFPGESGFLSCNPNKTQKNYFSVDFSRDLNCIIGGRGTGKSTLLNIIETVLTLESDDIKKLEFISRHERIYILFYYKNCDYLIEFVPQKKDLDREYYTDNIFLEGAFSKSLSSKYKLSSHWIQLYKVEDNNYNKIPEKQSYEILSDVYKRTYSINSIINQVNKGKIGEFIREVILNGMNNDEIMSYLKKLNTIRKSSFRKYLRENIQEMIKAVETRRKQIEEHLDEYNKEYKDFIEIIYSPRKKNIDYYLKDLLDEISNDENILNTRLTWNDVARYIQTVSKKIGYMNFLDLLFNKRFKELQEHLNISDMVQKRAENYSDIENEYDILDSKKAENILQKIHIVLSDNYRPFLIDSIYKWFKVVDDFTLKFNINSKEQTYQSKPVMKEITEMSLGQKVVAILTFIFNYGYYVNDNTPLIIDQPEDNLDNQYIYKNLVESLKQIKNNRQVIIVTHNSTIVTNSDTEQVIVMDSNHSNGWVENKGYPTDKRITKLIIIFLEGGIESFKHKMQTYTLFINELNEN